MASELRATDAPVRACALSKAARSISRLAAELLLADYHGFKKRAELHPKIETRMVHPAETRRLRYLTPVCNRVLSYVFKSFVINQSSKFYVDSIRL